MAINQSLESIDCKELWDIVSSFKDLILHIRTIKGQKELNKYGKNTKIADFNSVRWSSTFLSLDDLFNKRRVLLEYFNEQVCIFNSKNNKYVQDFNRYGKGIKPIKPDIVLAMEKIKDIHWDYLESLLKYLRMFYEYTKELQFENQTISLAYLGFKILVNDQIAVKTGEYRIIVKFLKTFKKTILEKFEDIINNENIILSCYIDPRTKDFIEKKNVGFTVEEYNKSKEILLNKMKEIKRVDTTETAERYVMKGKYDIYRNNTEITTEASEDVQIETEFNKWLLFNKYISTE